MSERSLPDQLLDLAEAGEGYVVWSAEDSEAVDTDPTPPFGIERPAVAS